MGRAEGDHIDFHDNVIDKAVGAEHHHHYPPKPRPGQIVEGDIPQRPPGFQPREPLLRWLGDLLDSPAVDGDNGAGGAVVICALGGIPGVGKTMLAASYAWACQAARWPVVAWIAAETNDQILTGLAALAERLGERRTDDDAATAAARARSWMAATDRPVLLVFDNATDVEAMRRWCPATGATRVVITSRNRAFLRLYEPLEVEVFTAGQAADYLHVRTGLADRDGAAKVAAELGYLPLALTQAAAVITRLRIDYTRYLRLLHGVPIGEYLPAQQGGNYPAGTAEAILLSITRAETALPFARDLLPMVAMLSPAGIPLPVLHCLNTASGEPIQVQQMLADLTDTSLITFSEDGTSVLMHRLVQCVLRDRADHLGDLATPLSQATNLLLVFSDTVPVGGRTWAARDKVDMLIDQTDTLYRWAAPRERLSADLLVLRSRCGRYLSDLADLGRSISLHKATLADCERVLGADHPDTLASRNNLAGAYRSAGDLGRAIPLYEATLSACKRVLGTDHPTTQVVRNNLEVATAEGGRGPATWWRRLLPSGRRADR